MFQPYSCPEPRPDDIAVVGAGCRFPGGIRDLDSLWEVLADGGDVVRETPADRWDDSFHHPDRRTPGTTYCRQGGFLTDIDRFDAEFFGISPREAREMDPQQRLLLEVTSEAMEDAGVPRERWSGTRTSVHMGILGSDYLLLHAKTAGIESVNPYFATGKEFSFAAGRIAYLFGLHGAAMTVNTACSSSLVALHLACQSLRSGEADTALAGGVNVIVSPELSVFMGKVQALSPTGRCKPFDARADGVVRGEGCGVVVLKRHADAVRDGDRVHGVVRGSAVNQDGYSAGLTAPNAQAQQMLLRSALDSAGLDPAAVAYIETHGTGTPLGDPVEVSAISEVVSKGRPDSHRLLIGSHKANFGHMDSAAGIAGLLKTLLVLRHGTVPQQIHYEQPSPHIDWEEARVVVPTAPTPLPPADGPAVAGVSAFGLSGTNAHVLLSAASPVPAGVPSPPGGVRTLLLSASTAEGLRSLAGDYRDAVRAADTTSREPQDEQKGPERPEEQREQDPLDAMAAAAAVRRTHLPHRLAVVGTGAPELGAALDAFHRGERHPDALDGAVPENPLPVVFVFSGQGSQWPGMAADLYAAHPVVRESLDACEELIRTHGGWSLLDALRASDPARLRATEVAQPAVFAVQTALARLLESWGVVPGAVIGHSMGEVTAACVAGALPLPDAVRLIVERGRLMQQADGTGRMVSVELPAGEVRTLLADGHPEVCVATVNGPRSVVIAGPPAPVEAAVAALSPHGTTTALPVDYAFHSPLMRPFGDALEEFMAGLAPERPRVRFLSTASPGGDRPLDARYWGDNLREPVLFWPAVDGYLAGEDAAFVEIGVHPVLSRPLRAAVAHRERRGEVTGTLARGQDGVRELARTRSRLHAAGVPVGWSRSFPGPVRPVSLPPHRWAEERHWLEGVPRGRQSRPSGGVSAGGLRAEVRLYDAEDRLVGEVTGVTDAPGRSPAPARPGADGTRREHTAGAAAAAPAAAPAAPDGSPGPVGPAGGPADRERLAATVHDALTELLGYDRSKRLPRARGFFELGLDSISVVELARRLSGALGVPLDGADVLSHASVDALTGHLLTAGARVVPAASPQPPPATAPATTPAPATPAPQPEPVTAASPQDPRDQQPPPTTAPATTPAPVTHAAPAAPAAGPEPVAIVGLGCRLPGGADSPDRFWDLLSSGTDATGEVPAARWDAAELLAASAEVTPGTVATSRGGFLDRVDGFDHGFFRVSPREARSMDPQQRMLLEVAWEALEDAGIPVRTLRGSRTGVFVGLNTTDYQQLVTRRRTDIDLYYGTGNSFSGSAGRLSYFLGTRGPSMAVDTACSSSLTAVHLACQSLRSGESEVAIVGGANVMATPTVFLAMSAAGALAPDGRCKTFDDSADGYGRGEGAGAVILKPLSRARRDGDRVHAVIRGSAVNQDGASGGLTVPSGDAQQEVIRSALAQAGLAAHEVGYVEAHGTGTRLGDAVELRALAGALGSGRPDGERLLVGSVKTNVGHLEAAAGVTGLIKVVLSLRHERIPAHLHVQNPTRQIDWDRLPVEVATAAAPWARGGRPRVAGVSAFGFTGTNAHVLVEEPPAPGRPAAAPARTPVPRVLTASAATPEALTAAAARLRSRLAAADDAELADICWTSAARRDHHEHRLAVTGSGRRELMAGLEAASRGGTGRGVHLGTAPADGRGRLVFLLGDAPADLPWERLPGARQDLPETGGFRRVLAEADAALREAAGISPRRIWERSEPPPPAGSRQEAALVLAGHLVRCALWEESGVTPDAVAGGGAGEAAAACLAGELGTAEAVRLLLSGEPVPAADGTGRLPRYPSAAHPRALAGKLAADGVVAVLGSGLGTAEEELRSELARAGASGISVLPAAPPVPDTAEPAELLELAAGLHVRGCRVDWARVLRRGSEPGGRVVSLPGYPWQRRSHWIGAGTGAAVPPVAPPAGAGADTAADTVPPAAPEAVPDAVPAASAPQDAAPLVAELLGLPGAQQEERLLTATLGWVEEVLGGAGDVAPDQGFFDLGMDSVLSQELKRRAEKELGETLPGTVIFECPNARSFVRFLIEEILGPAGASPAGRPARPGAEAPAGDAPAAPGTHKPAGGPLTGNPTDDPTDDALMEHALSLLASSEALLSEGD